MLAAARRRRQTAAAGRPSVATRFTRAASVRRCRCHLSTAAANTAAWVTT